MEQDELISNIEDNTSDRVSTGTQTQPPVQQEQVMPRNQNQQFQQEEQTPFQQAPVSKPKKKMSLTKLLTLISYIIIIIMFTFIIVFGYLLGQ